MAFPHSISKKTNKSASRACWWFNEAVSLFIDWHYFYDYFQVFWTSLMLLVGHIGGRHRGR